MKRGDVRDCVRSLQQFIRAKKPDAEKAGHRRANQAKSFIAQIYSWAEDQEILEHNPARFKKMFRDEPLKRIGAMTDDLLRTFWVSLGEEDNDPKFHEGKATSLAIKLAIALGHARMK